MSQSQTRKQVLQHLSQHGPIEDSTGRATAKLRQALGYQGSQENFTELIANMDRAGQFTREVKGKRTYPIVPVDSSPSNVDNKPAKMRQTCGYGLRHIGLRLTCSGRSDSEPGTSRARDGRVLGTPPDRTTRAAYRRYGARPVAGKSSVEDSQGRTCQLRVQLQHSEGNLTFLTNRLSTGKPRDGQLSKLLRADDAH